MNLGIVFPQTETDTDAGKIRDFAEAVEAMGYDHLSTYDHVLGASPDRPGGWSGPYTHQDRFHETLVLFGYLAAITTRLELVTEILILPQRQAVLVAKQATEIDLLSGERLRLGVGIGWNQVEMEGMGENFQNRGRRVEEQIEVMRLLWKEPLVKFDGEFHHIDNAGLNPLPSRLIPVWMGGSAEMALKRIARIADGWMTNPPHDRDPEALERMWQMVEENGRSRKGFGIDVRVTLRQGMGSALERAVAARSWGVTHLTLVTGGAALDWPGGHLKAAEEFKKAFAEG